MDNKLTPPAIARAGAILGLAGCLLLSGCGARESGTAPDDARGASPLANNEQRQEGNTPPPSGNQNEQREDREHREPRFAIEDYDASVAEAQQAFAFAVYQAIRAADDSEGANDFISPLSIATALSMTANGADGDTLAAMLQALEMPEIAEEQRNHAYEVLLDLLGNGNPDIELSVANSLWAREGFVLGQPFAAANKAFYNAEVATLDFTQPEAVEQMNGWVREQTKERIEEIITGPIDDNAMLFLMNAIYFKAGWMFPFDESNTSARPFTNADGEERQVQMMSRDGSFSYLDGDGFQAVRLAYAGGSMSMAIFLPDEDAGLEPFLDGLSADAWRKALGEFKPASGQLKMPRFTFEYEQTLNKALQALGMGAAFEPNAADFSRMVDSSAAGLQELHISEVKHKAFIAVDEQGTEAAAVTSVGVSTTSAPSETFEMEVNRPFFFAIHDHSTDTLLFMGSVRDIVE